jgi:hypothetical protein
MIDRLIEETFLKNSTTPLESREKLFRDLFNGARVKLKSFKEDKEKSLLDRWNKSRTNRNDLIRLMLQIESSNLPAALDKLLPSDPEKPTVSEREEHYPFFLTLTSLTTVGSDLEGILPPHETFLSTKSEGEKL